MWTLPILCICPTICLICASVLDSTFNLLSLKPLPLSFSLSLSQNYYMPSRPVSTTFLPHPSPPPLSLPALRRGHRPTSHSSQGLPPSPHTHTLTHTSPRPVGNICFNPTRVKIVVMCVCVCVCYIEGKVSINTCENMKRARVPTEIMSTNFIRDDNDDGEQLSER